MQYITKLKLAAIHQFCDVNDKTTEYMYQLMQDVAKVDLDTVNNYLLKEDNSKLFKELNDLTDVMILLGQ